MAVARRLFAACFFSLITSCQVQGPLAPEVPADAERIAPPEIYRQWWREVEQCSGQRAHFASVSYYVVPEVYYWWSTEYQWTLAGLWVHRGNRIYLAGHYQLDADRVRHEMLHAILQEGIHRPIYFEKRCRGVVAVGAGGR